MKERKVLLAAFVALYLIEFLAAVDVGCISAVVSLSNALEWRSGSIDAELLCGLIWREFYWFVASGRNLRSVSGRQDLNLRPPGPQPGALPDCATPRGPSTVCKRATGIEPALEAWKAPVQPQHLARITNFS